MAIHKLYKLLQIETGKIVLRDYPHYSDTLLLDTIEVEYDDNLREEHRQMLVDKIEENIAEKTKKHNAEMFKLNQLRNQLLQIEHKPMEGELMPREDNPPPFEFDEDIPF